MSYGTHREVGNVEKREAQYNATLNAGAEGFALGTGLSLLGGMFAQRRIATIRNLPFSIKFSLVLSSGLATGVIFADRAAHYTDSAAKASRRLQTLNEERWKELSSADRTLAWVKDNKFSVVIGSWLTSMVGSWLYIQSQPLSFSQKLVQARVWAQGLTIASLLLMAGVTHIPSEADKLLREEAEEANHTWRDMLKSDNQMNHKYVVLHKGGKQKEVKKGEELEDDVIRGLDASQGKAKMLSREFAKESDEAFEKLRSDAKEVYKDAKDNAENVGGDVKNAAGQAENKLENATKDAKENAENVGEDVKNAAGKAENKLEDATKDVAKGAKQ